MIAAKLLALAAVTSLASKSLVVVPDGHAGVRVSQISGVRAGTLYPGTHLIFPLTERVVLYDVRDQVFSIPPTSFLIRLPRKSHAHQLSQRHFRSGIDLAPRHHVPANHRPLAGRNRKVNMLAAFLHRSRNRHNLKMPSVNVRLRLIRISNRSLRQTPHRTQQHRCLNMILLHVRANRAQQVISRPQPENMNAHATGRNRFMMFRK